MKFKLKDASQFGWDGLKGWAYNSKDDFLNASGAYFEVTGSHGMVMRYIKYDAMRTFALERLDESPCMVSGVRRKESKRRMSFDEPINHDGNLWFVCPFLEKSTEEVYTYLSEHNLRKSPAYTNLHISGDCLCGAFSRDPSEILMLKGFYPDMYNKIRHLELDVKLSVERLETELRMMERKDATLKDVDERKKRKQRVKRDPNMSEYEKKMEQLSRLRRFSKWGNNAGATAVENQTTLDLLICGECSINQ